MVAYSPPTRPFAGVDLGLWKHVFGIRVTSLVCYRKKRMWNRLFFFRVVEMRLEEDDFGTGVAVFRHRFATLMQLVPV